MITDPVMLAAQADLVLLTVEMLRPPANLRHRELPSGQQSVATDAGAGAWTPWFTLSPGQLDELLSAGLGPRNLHALDDPSDPTPRSALAEVQRCASDFDTHEWALQYVRMFDGATACPLTQASYIRRDKGKILGDVSGFYMAFGWQRGSDTGERPDHLLCQLEFVAMLLALASQAPDQAAREVVTAALSEFAREHMHDWLPAVCWQMCQASQVEYFGAVSQWLLVLWLALTDLHHWPVDQLPTRHLMPIVDPDDPYECGALELHQIQAP